MKLTKLSLAALVALGALSTTASATPLEEAIKGVDLKGFVRLRYYNYVDDSSNGNDNRYRFSAPFTFKMPVADNLTATVTVRGEGSNYEDAGTAATDTNFDMVKAFFTYATSDYTVIAGKQPVGTPWTSPAYGDTRGDGILALYTGIQGWTFAAGHMANTVNASTDGTAVAGVVGSAIDSEAISIAAAITSFGPVNAQLWYADIEHVGDSVFAQLDGKMDAFWAKGQVYMTQVDDFIAGADRNTFWGLAAGYKADGFGIDVGYTKNSDDSAGIYTLYGDDTTSIKFGKQLYYVTTNAVDADVAFANVSYKTGKYGVNAGYGAGEYGAAGVDIDEWYVGASYQYAKNFGVNAYYSVMDNDAAADDSGEFRVCAKYSF